QHASHRAGPEARASVGAHGRRRHPGMWLRAKLRRDLSERYSADDIDFRSRWPGHETGPRRPVAEVTALCGTPLPSVETGLAPSAITPSPEATNRRVYANSEGA